MPPCEADPHRLDAPRRVKASRRGGTRAGSLLRQSIPLRGEGTEEGPGWLELDTVALCGRRARDDHPAVAGLSNARCKGPPGRLLNHFLPTPPLREKRRGQRVVRGYGPARTPCVQGLATREVPQATPARLRGEPASLNPFQRAREVERQQKALAGQRQPAT